jgi:hypothetical protein
MTTIDVSGKVVAGSGTPTYYFSSTTLSPYNVSPEGIISGNSGFIG